MLGESFAYSYPLVSCDLVSLLAGCFLQLVFAASSFSFFSLCALHANGAQVLIEYRSLTVYCPELACALVSILRGLLGCVAAGSDC